MAITSFDPRQPRIVPSGGRVTEITDAYLEANSQSFLAGELVYFNAGAVTETAAGDKPIAGRALADATSVSSGNITIPVELINIDDDVYIQVAASGGAVEAADTTCVPGVAYDVQLASNHWTLNSSDTTNPKFVFIEAIKDATGASTVWARCKPYYLENQVVAG